MAEKKPAPGGGKKGKSGYDAKDIQVLERREAVRKRPGMYIGSTGTRGLHHLVYEGVANSVAKALAPPSATAAGTTPPDHSAGPRGTGAVTTHPDNSVTVVDEGRGLPVDTMEKEGRPAGEVVLAILPAG